MSTSVDLPPPPAYGRRSVDARSASACLSQCFFASPRFDRHARPHLCVSAGVHYSAAQPSLETSPHGVSHRECPRWTAEVRVFGAEKMPWTAVHSPRTHGFAFRSGSLVCLWMCITLRHSSWHTLLSGLLCSQG